MPTTSAARLVRLVLFHLAGAVGGYLMSILHVPLPWMIGSMLAAAIITLSSAKAPQLPRFTRKTGQVVVASTVGLSFTPDALRAVGDQAPAMVGAAILTIAFALVLSWLLMRIGKIDLITSCLACIPGGPAEMATLAEHYGRAPGPIVFAQTVRIFLIVIFIPPLLVGFDPDAASGLALSTWNGEIGGPILLLAGGVAGSLLFERLNIPNPYFLGAILFSAFATVVGLPVSALPFSVLAAAQVLLGTWLGSSVDRDLMAHARGFVALSLVATVFLLLLCAAMAVGLAFATGARWETMIIATAPGSVTEMALTAKILGVDAATVTAYHVIRIFIIIPGSPWLFAVLHRFSGRPAEAAGARGQAPPARLPDDDD